MKEKNIWHGLSLNKIYNMDCLEGMKLLADNSVDAIVTDPPYWLSFMGKKRDYDVPSQEIREEALRVLKPWWYLLAFAGTRTQHRMAVRIEDAGFEIRDMIAWVYGSGFPKSLNIGKAVDKLQGNEREVSGYEERFGREGRKAKCGFKEEYVGASGTQDQSAMKPIMLPVSEEAKQWEGWGTALKPALEPITVARKPLWDWWFDVAKSICIHIIENSLYDNDIIWRIKNVKNVERQKKLKTFSTTEQQKMVEVSVSSVNSKEMQCVGIEIEKLLERMQGDTETTIEKRKIKEVELITEQTEKEYLQINKHTNWKENLIQLKNTDEDVSVVEKQSENLWLLTTQNDDEESIGSLLNEEIYTHSWKKNDTQRNDIDCYVWTATSQWVYMDIVHTIKIEFQNKYYEIEQLSDGSFIWNNKIKPYIESKSLNVAENVLKWGTGGINIDGCRVEGTYENEGRNVRQEDYKSESEFLTALSKEGRKTRSDSNSLGRFPANFIWSCNEDEYKYNGLESDLLEIQQILWE